MLKSPKQLLVEHLYQQRYGGDLEADVRAWIAEGMPLREMARITSARCAYEISYESLRRWYRIDAVHHAQRMRDAKSKANTPLPLDDDPDAALRATAS